MEPLDPAARPVLVLDFGAQYVQLIARRVRERHAFARIVRHDITPDRVRELNPLALILSGGPSQRLRARRPALRPGAFRPGHSRARHLLRHATGLRGAGRPGARLPARGEFGRAECQVARRRPSLSSTTSPTQTIVWMSHGDQVHDAGPDFVPLAVTSTCPIAAVKHRSRPFYGLQFHPEVSHTPYGSLILGNFLDRICQQPAELDDGRVHRAVDRARSTGRSARTTAWSAAFRAASIRRSAAALLARALGTARRLRLRRQRPAPRRRATTPWRRPSAPHVQRRAAGRRRRRPVPRSAPRRDRTAGEAAADRPHVHRRLPRRGPVDPEPPTSWPRERSTPT